MTTRRRFIQTLAAIPPALYFRPALAAPDPSRLALIIGNSGYRDAPLVNPANDAKAVGGLFTQAGFTVDSHLNTTRAGMMAAIERFGTAAKRGDTRLVVFYYAGHGAQLDWRNYLLPVDAVVEKPEHMKDRCVDLNLLLGQFSAAKGKTFVVILDACRNNPFGTSFRPDQKGLSQFDAPVGSLLAYATSPGNVASDGEGQNGLYTENLVRELSRRSTRIEDALKRVRLNVRLASHGEQIPWETTSLENDVFIFNEGQKKLTEAELEQLVEADVTEWARIKSSKKIDDWVGYLRTFPNGRFAEIAQMRLTRLLAEVEAPKTPAGPSPQEQAAKVEKLATEEKQKEELQAAEQKRIEQQKQALAAAKPAPVPPPTPSPAAVQPARPAAAPVLPASSMLDIRAGMPIPVLIPPSTNPFSAGRYPLGRIFTVGDTCTVRQSDLLTGIEERIYSPRVTKVDYDEDRVELGNGLTVTDLMGNAIKSGPVLFDSPVQFIPLEFQVGKKWTAAFRRTLDGRTTNAYYDLHIVKRETITAPAGIFDTFRIEGFGWNTTDSARLEVRLWLVPGLNFGIRREIVTRNKFGRFGQTELHELVALKQSVWVRPT